MSEEYDLKKSKETIGQLYPILEAKDGEIIDGFHREEADKNWKRVRLEHIDTEEKKLIARLVANFHRRPITREEKAEWINGLAEIYKKQGLKIRIGIEGKNEISEKIQEVTGLSKTTVVNYLYTDYKQEPAHIPDKPRVPASQAIASQIGEDYGKQLVERHREEVKQELLKSPEFQREVLKEISKPQILKVTEPCPSGVCAVPQSQDFGKPIDIEAERLATFWKEHPDCKCKSCKHYEDCGVIRC